MGVRIKNSGALGVQLLKTADKSTRALRRVQLQGAHEIAEIAGEMAPYKKGDLEDSFVVEKMMGMKNRTTYTVKSVGLPYAVRMHESVYNLGPGSVEKSESGRFVVGRKFLTRAVDYVVHDLKFMERARRAVRMK